MALIKKELLLTYFNTFFSHQGKDTKKPISTYLTYKNTRILITQLTFFASPILQKIRIYLVLILFGAPSDVDSYLRHFGAINK